MRRCFVLLYLPLYRNLQRSSWPAWSSLSACACLRVWVYIGQPALLRLTGLCCGWCREKERERDEMNKSSLSSRGVVPHLSKCTPQRLALLQDPKGTSPQTDVPLHSPQSGLSEGRLKRARDTLGDSHMIYSDWSEPTSAWYNVCMHRPTYAEDVHHLQTLKSGHNCTKLYKWLIC